MNLGSRFRINLKNLMICKVFFFWIQEDRGERKQRERENQMREERESDEREKTIKKKLNGKLQ